VRRAREIVVDVARDRVRRQLVPETFEQLAELVGRQEVEQHQHVSLLRDLVAVGSVLLGLEDAIQSVDVAVPGVVVLPVELAEILVALELADDAVVMGDEHRAADVLPAVEPLA
jgi:hypothetical protein